jgi:hypothetical protein
MRIRSLLLGATVVVLGFLFFGDALQLLAPTPCPLRDSDEAYLLPPASSLAGAGQARAIPAFSRKYNVTCTTCHTGYAYLNKTGRTFKEVGFRLPDEEGQFPEAMQNHLKISDSLVLEKMLPLALRLTSLPVDVVPTGDFSSAQMVFSPISSFGLFAFGNFFQYGSFFVTVEAGTPDDPTAPLNVPNFGFSGAKIGVHPSQCFNVMAGWAAPLSTDPYVTLASADNVITIHDRLLLSQTFDSSVNLVDAAPFVTFYGRTGPVFYSAGLVAPPNRMVAVNPTAAQGRLAVDVMDQLTLGTFGMGGQAFNNDNASIYNFGRVGADLNFGTQDYHLSAIGLFAIDQTGNAASTNYWGASGEFVYFFTQSGLPVFMPLARLEWFQGAGNTNTVNALVGGAFFMRQNFRLGLDANVDLLPAVEGQRNWRTTLYADLVF